MKAGADSNVVALGAEPVRSDRREEFMRAVAASYDGFTAAHGEEPEALVFFLGGIRQDGHAYWMVKGDSEGAAGPLIATAAAVFLRS